MECECHHHWVGSMAEKSPTKSSRVSEGGSHTKGRCPWGHEEPPRGVWVPSGLGRKALNSPAHQSETQVSWKGSSPGVQPKRATSRSPEGPSVLWGHRGSSPQPDGCLLKGILGAKEGWVRRREEAEIWQLLSMCLMRDIGRQLAWATQATGGEEEVDQVHMPYA